MGRWGVRAWLKRLLAYFPAGLASLGLVDRRKGAEAFDLAVPVMVTGGLRVLIRMADFLFVGIALGDAAIAGLEFGFQYSSSASASRSRSLRGRSASSPGSRALANGRGPTSPSRSRCGSPS